MTTNFQPHLIFHAARSSLLFSGDHEQLGRLSTKVEAARACAITSFLQWGMTGYFTAVSPLITRKIVLLSSADPMENLEHSLAVIKAQALRCEMEFLCFCYNNRLPVADEHLVALYTSIQLLLPSISSLPESSQDDLLIAMHLSFNHMHRLADHQMAKHAAADPLARALVDYHAQNNDFLFTLSPARRAGALKKKAPIMDLNLATYENRIRDLPDSPKKCLYTYFLVSIRDRFCAKIVSLRTLPKLMFQTVRYFADNAENACSSATTQEKRELALGLTKGATTQIKKVLAVFHTTICEKTRLARLMTNMITKQSSIETQLACARLTNTTTATTPAPSLLSPVTTIGGASVETYAPSPFTPIGDTEEEIMKVFETVKEK